MSDRAICVKCGDVCSGCLTGCSHSPCPHCGCITVPLIFHCEYCSEADVDEPGLFCKECQVETGQKNWQYSTNKGYYV